MDKDKQKGDRGEEKDKRRIEHIENDSQDFGRYGREPKSVPPKSIKSTETMQSKEEIFDKEIQKAQAGQNPDSMYDNVCGKELTSGSQTNYQAEHNHREYKFCSKNCLELFLKSPEDYIQ
jgi:YHS domain-containing protein